MTATILSTIKAEADIDYLITKIKKRRRGADRKPVFKFFHAQHPTFEDLLKTARRRTKEATENNKSAMSRKVMVRSSYPLLESDVSPAINSQWKKNRKNYEMPCWHFSQTQTEWDHETVITGINLSVHPLW